MPEADMYDLVIIGGGPAGLSAGLYAGRAALKTILIEKGVIGGQVMTTKGVENYLGYEEISGFELSEKFFRHTQAYGLEVIQQEVVFLEPGDEAHSVRLDDGRSIRSHAVIIATGGSPRRLNVPGEEKYWGRGVSYCAKCDGLFFRGQRVVVVGGGDSAAEEAVYLSKIAKEVHLVHIESTLKASKILQQRLMQECNIVVHPDTTVVEIMGTDQGVDAVNLKNQRNGKVTELPTDGVFVFIGLTPNTSLAAPHMRLNHDGYVVTNDRCETSIPGIFAVGDLREKYANQIVIAVADGCVGALAAAQYVEMKKEREKNYCEYIPRLRIAA